MDGSFHRRKKMSDDYIRRQAAIDIVVFECGKWTGLAKEISKQLKQLSVDVVQVVRCKDCKFYTSMRPDIKTGICDLNVHHMGDDGFCSCGERREE